MPRGHEVNTLAFGVGNLGTGAPALAAGDTFTIEGRIYRAHHGWRRSPRATSPSRWPRPARRPPRLLALSTAINAEYAAGRTSVVASGATASAPGPDLGQVRRRASSTTPRLRPVRRRRRSPRPVWPLPTARASKPCGTLTLSSAASFTLGGADLANGGLSTASPALTRLDTVDISTVEGANAAIAVLDGALSQVTSIRADLGAVQNRFSSTVANLQATSENLSAARSRILRCGLREGNRLADPRADPAAGRHGDSRPGECDPAERPLAASISVR